MIAEFVLDIPNTITPLWTSESLVGNVDRARAGPLILREQGRSGVLHDPTTFDGFYTQERQGVKHAK